MVRPAFTFAWLFFLIGHACAQGGMMPGPGTVHTTGGAPYSGPGDLAGWTSPYAFYSSYAMTAAIAATGTQKAWNLKRASDNHTCDLLIGTAGYINVTANCSTPADNGQTPATWGTGTLNLVTAYDQSGNSRDLAAACSTGVGALITGISSKFSAHFVGNSSNGCMEKGSTPGASAPVTYASVALRTSIDAGINGLVGGAYTSGGSFMYFDNAAANSVGVYGGGAGGMSASGALDGSPHALVGVINGTSSIVNIDGTETANGTNIGSGGFSTVISMGGSSAIGSYLRGEIGELMMVVGAPTLTQRNAYISDARSRFGF